MKIGNEEADLMNRVCAELAKQTIDLPPAAAKIIEENFWDLIERPAIICKAQHVVNDGSGTTMTCTLKLGHEGYHFDEEESARWLGEKKIVCKECEYCSGKGGRWDEECQDQWYWCDYCDALDKHLERKFANRVPSKAELLVARINDYLDNGGLFNPEHVDHNKVRELLIDLKNYLT